MLNAFFLGVISLLELCSLSHDFFSLSAQSAEHLVRDLSLAFLITHGWSIWLDQIPSEDGVKAVLEEEIVTDGLHLSQVA